MNIQEILSLPQENWLEELQVDPVKGRNVQANINYFNGAHPILTDPNRQDYQVQKWEIDEQTGRPKTNPQTGKKIRGVSETVQRTRLVLNYQKQIIDTAVGMVVGNPVTLTLNNNDSEDHKEAFDKFVDQWKNKARLDTFSKNMMRSLLVESKCAELYWLDGEEEKELKVMLLSKENGDDIWAHFDDNRKMDALTRVFKKRALIDGKPEDVEVTQIWTAEKRYEKTGGDGEWEEFVNPYQKLQVVYYDQKEPEWAIVTDLISKQELVRSRNSDVNKRIGNPNVVVDGAIDGLPDVEQDVKVWNTKPVSDGQGGLLKSSVSYLQIEGAPEAIKMEVDQDKQDMYKLTWPDLSFLRDAIKTGTLSGTAIELMFTDSFVKIGNKKGILEDFSRRVAVIKKMLAIANADEIFNELNISVQFNSILPKNIVEIADTLSTAIHANITSKENAQQLFPLNAGNPDIAEQIEEEEGRLEGGVAP